jgi:hypothetical protein
MSSIVCRTSFVMIRSGRSAWSSSAIRASAASSSAVPPHARCVVDGQVCYEQPTTVIGDSGQVAWRLEQRQKSARDARPPECAYKSLDGGPYCHTCPDPFGYLRSFGGHVEGRACSPDLHDWEDNCRGMRRVMVYNLVGGDERGRCGERLPTAQVAGEARVRAAGYLDTEAMPAPEAVGRGPEIDPDL